MDNPETPQQVHLPDSSSNISKIKRKLSRYSENTKSHAKLSHNLSETPKFED